MTMLRDFPALVTLADTLHFGRAAETLRISQPQLSTIIRRIETRSGVRLFERRPVVRPTPEGEALIAAARRALAEAEGGIAQAKAIGAGHSGLVRIGLAPVAALTPLMPVLGAYRANNAGVMVELTERHSATLWDDLKHDRLDLIVTREARREPRSHSVEIMREPIAVALPTDHPKAGCDKFYASDLRGERLVFWDRATAVEYHDEILEYLRADGVEPDIVQRVNGWPAMLALVEHRFGIALVSRSLSRIGFPGIVFKPINDFAGEAVFWLSCYPGRLSPGALRLHQALVGALASSQDADVCR